MSQVVELIVPNSAEYHLRNPSLNLTGEERERVVRFSGTYECEHSVFWSPNPRVLVLPTGWNRQWFDDIHRTLGLDPAPVVSPAMRTGLLVEDLLKDGDAQAELRELLSPYRVVRLHIVGPTPQTYLLAALVRGWGLAVELDHVDEDAYWASLYLDSKISPLDLARELPGINVAQGMVAGNWVELRGALKAMTARHGRVIARTLFGVAGDGSGVVSDAPGAVEEFLDNAGRDSFFAFPILVQQFQEHAEGVGCPAADILVGENGVEDVVLCALTVEHGYSFRSVDVGVGALPPAWGDRVTQVAHELGTAAHRLGYRGWMCVDCVAGSDDRLYVTEINARRSGSLHAGGLLRMWGAEKELTLSAHFMLPVVEGTTYEEHIRPVFQELWADGVKAYPTSVRALPWPEPIVAVIAAAPTAAQAQRIVAGIKEGIDARTAGLAAGAGAAEPSRG
ncbi:hypothetical protein F7Q99_00175 [Streptomyces kaniharaensis]|uniref:ATP-grasp domain-containing protein n=1 Tax=Streptomyces kaniharaensis TaxID=212423 RepID=A0A6N7KK56_9ACTN|nr:hypothetical protein [Streptomyces kaniharaensis]MQS10737.1 hypothetical protein [Streptomyces kaniharaensis]